MINLAEAEGNTVIILRREVVEFDLEDSTFTQLLEKNMRNHRNHD